MKRQVLALSVISFGLVLGSCVRLSSTVSDTWPHWAGGEPSNTPPRPGAPGYQEFISHGQTGSVTGQPQTSLETGSAAASPVPTAPSVRPVSTNQPPAQAPVPTPTPMPGQAAQDDTVRGGGLY